MTLAPYRARRNFRETPEPEGGAPRQAPALRYSVQCHEATRLHWDLRLEWQGVLLSWAVTRGPSLDPSDKRLAVRTEDHPFDYLAFEGVIPDGNYGAGRVMLWDLGWWQPFHDVDNGLTAGHLHFALHGRRATGGWSLVRLKPRQGERAENWLMVKDRDAAAVTGGTPFGSAFDRSVATNRTFDQIASNGPARPFGPPRRQGTPAFHPVQLASAGPLPQSEGWVHEVKLDGYRAQAAIGAGGVRIFTRNGHDWSDRFAELCPSLAELPCKSALIDGEIVAGAGLSGFSDLQRAIKAGGPFQFFAFDLVHLDGADLADKPLSDRRRRLEGLIGKAIPRGAVRLSPALEGGADAALSAICAAGGEGIVSKLADAPYRSGRTSAWVKVKCNRRAEFIIVGWQPSRARGRQFSSLLVATVDDGRLTYRGKVGTGFDDGEMDALAQDLTRLRVGLSPLPTIPHEAKGAVWVEPRLVAEIAHTELTRDGHLRHARFVALRDDKPFDQVGMDPPPEKDETPDPARPVVAGVGISNPGRILFPNRRITKLDLATYYEAVADRVLPGVADRPMSLLRLPSGLNGERFFQKHAGAGFPPSVSRVKISDPDGQVREWLAISGVEGLVGVVQMGTVEFHPWGARIDRPENPERLVFDLDPDDGLDFAPVRSAAFDLRDLLADLGIPTLPMVSGGKGIHVIVPLNRTASWDTAKLFTKLVAHHMAEAEPDRFTAALSKSTRKGRIFIDYLRNERGATAVAAFSVRARPDAPVALPVSWDELSRVRSAGAFSMAAALERHDRDVPSVKAVTLSARVVSRLADRIVRRSG